MAAGRWLNMTETTILGARHSQSRPRHTPEPANVDSSETATVSSDLRRCSGLPTWGVVGLDAESRIELSRGNDNAAARAQAPLRHRLSETLNFRPLPLEYLQEYFSAAVLPVQSLSDQQSSVRYEALLKAATSTWRI